VDGATPVRVVVVDTCARRIPVKSKRAQTAKGILGTIVDILIGTLILRRRLELVLRRFSIRQAFCHSSTP
jgi:hypothetical protein